MSILMPYSLTDFSNANNAKEWRVVNDGVMGGKSQAEFHFSKVQTAIFQGHVSLENSGGFSSVRKTLEPLNIAAASHVKIELKADGKNLQFRLKENQDDRHAYKYEFETSGEWQIIEIPLNKMQPTFRGSRPDLPNFSSDQIAEIGFLIANKRNEDFRLEIESIWLANQL